MSNVVLVHGGWHGGWCWRAVEPLLAQHDCAVFCPTLTGLGERSHLVDCVQSPDTHVQDIVNVITWNELDNVTLVGHSYGGMIITGVASLIPERIAHLVYLDAFVPTNANEDPLALSDSNRMREIIAGGIGQ